MRAKFVFEAIGDVLKPKSQKEIDQGLEKIEMNKALDLAYRNNNFPMILKLLRKGAEFESLKSYYGSEDGNKKFIQTNRDKFFDDNPDKKFLNNLLKKASQIDFPDMAKWALDNGADIQFADGRGNTPLYYAAKYQSPNTLKLLVKRDADLNYQNKDGVTPILASITPSGKHPDPDTLFEIFKYLFEAGADMNIKTSYGHTAYDIISSGKLNRILNWLQDNNLIESDTKQISQMIRSGSLKSLKKAIEGGDIDLNKKQFVPRYSYEYDNYGNKIKENPLVTALEAIDLYHGTAFGKADYLISKGAKITQEFKNYIKNWRGYGWNIPNSTFNRKRDKFIEKHNL